MPEELQTLESIEQPQEVDTSHEASMEPTEQNEASDESTTPDIDADTDADIEAEDTPEPRLSDKALKEIGRLTKALADRQAEIAKLKAQQTDSKTAKSDTKQPTKNDDVHPALKGLELDTDGTALVDGQWVPQALLIQQHELREELAEIKQRFADADAQAEQARIESARQELFETIVEAATDACKNAFPNIPSDKEALVNKVVLTFTDSALSKALNDGAELTDELIVDSITDALREAKSVLGLFGARQLASNADYARKHRVKPDGTPGTPTPKDPDKMTKAERNSWLADIMRRTEAMRQQA